jgi:two-component system sensor histidine kinase DesK
MLVVLLGAFTLQTLNNIYVANLGPGAVALLASATGGVAAIQLYHSRSVLGGGRPRAWPLTLAIQTVLAFLPFVLHQSLLASMAGFTAGSFLLLVPGWWRWVGYAAVVCGWSALDATVPPAAGPQPGWSGQLYLTVAVALTGLVVYGVSWLAGAARQLDGLRGELARIAVVQERLRVARDVHDLLGLGLSAIALKADLIGRLIGRDNTRAAAEIAEMARICAHARADIRLVTEASGHLPLDAELAAAQEILASAGVDVRAEIDAGPLPAAPSAALAPVLREAVTNILRHSAATACTIEAAVTGGAVRLQVGNDGAGQAAGGGGAGQPLGGEHTGTGLANLTARMRAAGGRLDISHADGWFHLSAEVPL